MAALAASPGSGLDTPVRGHGDETDGGEVRLGPVAAGGGVYVGAGYVGACAAGSGAQTDVDCGDGGGEAEEDAEVLHFG